MEEKNEEDYKRIIRMKKRSAWISILSISVIAMSIVMFMYSNRNQSSQIAVQNDLIQQKDSFIQKQSQDSLVKSAKNDSINNIINRFFFLVNNHHYDSLQFYYADTLSRYFKYDSNITKGQVKVHEKWYYNWSQDYPHAAFDFSGSPIITGDTVLIRGMFQKSAGVAVPLAIELRLNKDLKVNYIRALYYK